MTLGAILLFTIGIYGVLWLVEITPGPSTIMAEWKGFLFFFMFSIATGIGLAMLAVGK